MAFVSIAILITSCVYDDFNPTEWAIDPSLTLENSGIVFNSLTGKETIKVETNYESFSATSNEDWCQVVANNDSSWVEIEVSPNDSVGQRIATVSVKVARGNKTLTKDISIVQTGGVWDVIGSFNVFWRYDVSESQKEAISEILNNLVYVEGGTFDMGLDGNTHSVTLSSFHIGKLEITQRQWNSIMLKNPSQYVGADLPVDNISWLEAFEFVSNLASLTSLNISLPTEAQWEYAACGGKYSLGYDYPGSNDYNTVAHCVRTSMSEDDPSYTTIKGGQYQPNELGLYDMAGNVAEFCYDWYDADYVFTDGETDPTGTDSGTQKVVKGGNFSSPFLCFNPRYRMYYTYNYSNEKNGFRIVLNQ